MTIYPNAHPCWEIVRLHRRLKENKNIVTVLKKRLIIEYSLISEMICLDILLCLRE